MALILWPLLLTIPISFVWAGPASSTSLTPYITSVVPTCALSCLQSFIARNYPTQVCTAQNLNCLCITPSTTGYTLGEAALTCLYSGCKQEDIQANEAYDICSTIPGAQPNIRSSLTASIIDQSPADVSRQGSSSTISPSGRSTQPSSSEISSIASSTRKRDTSSISISKSSASSSTKATTTSSATLSDDFVPNAPPSTIATPASASSSIPPAQSAALTKPQIAGVVIACIGAAALSLGFCFFLLCYRRRRKRTKKRQSDASWVGDKVPSSQGSSPDMAAIATTDFTLNEEPRRESKPPLRVVTPARGGWPDWPRGTHPSPHGIGLALAPDTPQPTKDGPSPITPRSYRTNSQLLPDRPHYSVFPPQPSKLAKRQSRSLHPPIPNYAPEKSPPMTGPRFPSSVDTSQANLQGGKRSMSDPFYNEQHSPQMDGYRGVPYTPWTNPAASVHIPLSTYQTSQNQLSAMDRSHSQKHPPRKKSASSSRYKRFSNDSATSFEDVDDDPTPARSTLSPVTEVRSPPQRTTRDAIPPLPIKSAKRTSHIINRPRPVPRRPGDDDEPAELTGESQARDVTQTAKWKIFVSPGLQSSIPSTPRTPRTSRTPTKVGRTPSMASDRLPRPAP